LRGNHNGLNLFSCESSILSELEFGDVCFSGGKKTVEPGENPSDQGENQLKLNPYIGTGPESNSLESLSKPRLRRQRERHQTKGLMSKTIAVHLRYKSLYISLPSSTKQEREMTKFFVVFATWRTTANFSYLHLELTPSFQI